MAIAELTDRERHILTKRRLKDDPTTLEDLAGEYGVSRKRVRQIEVRVRETAELDARGGCLLTASRNLRGKCNLGSRAFKRHSMREFGVAGGGRG